MQKVYIACLIASGVCVVIMCVGIGLGLALRSKDNLNENIIEYEAYPDDDYVNYDSSSGNTSTGIHWHTGLSVMHVRPRQEVKREECIMIY